MIKTKKTKKKRKKNKKRRPGILQSCAKGIRVSRYESESRIQGTGGPLIKCRNNHHGFTHSASNWKRRAKSSGIDQYRFKTITEFLPEKTSASFRLESSNIQRNICTCAVHDPIQAFEMQMREIETKTYDPICDPGLRNYS